MSPVQITFGPWLPDAPALGVPGVIVARNVIPTSRESAYHSMPTATPALSAPGAGSTNILAHAWAADDDREIHNFAGTTDTLLKLDSNRDWTDVSNVGYTGITSWEFAKFGERIIAVAPENAPQYYDLGTSTDFADLPGTPPRARCIAIVRDFVVVGDLHGTPSYPYRVQWSGFFNSQIWTTGDMMNQSDYQDFFGEGGRIQKIIGGEYGVIFQEHAIRMMDYVGPENIFRFSEVQQARGTPARGSVVKAGDAIFFYGWDGFSVLQGRSVSNIGDGKVNDWFRARTNAEMLQTTMTATIDRRRRLVIWSYPANGSSTNNEMLIYNWASGRWSYADTGYRTLSEWAAGGVTLDGLDALFGADIDAFTFSLDSDALKGGSVAVVGFDSAGVGNTFEGTPGEALIVCAEYSGGGGERLFVSEMRPLVDGTSTSDVTMGLYSRGGFGENPAAPTWVDLDTRGVAQVRVDARYLRPAVKIVGAFSQAQGAEVLLRPSGKR